MDVSWKWLKEYVSPSMDMETVVDRLTMSGLNHETTTPVGNDFCIDLEVTSNRPDCLGHLGIAREIATLFDLPLVVPDPQFETGSESLEKSCGLSLDSPAQCGRYTARLVRGVRVGPSPAWLVERLATIGIESINNVVDISNYVMMECGQPLHTFDFDKIQGGQIIVRDALAGEMLIAINHQEYELSPGMCVIADSDQPMAIGGVMGGIKTEIGEQTKDVLIEAAWFAPSSVRSTARRLNLHSDSSFRFERNVDIEGLDWASRRCTQLIVQVAGGKCVSGFLDERRTEPNLALIEFRLGQIERVLGIPIPEAFVIKTFKGLGLTVADQKPGCLTLRAPTWRKDLSREIDLIEELGRIYGYHHVPDTVQVPMTSSYWTPRQRLLSKIRKVMNAAGFNEAMCPSVLPEIWSNTCSPWTTSEPMISQQPMLGVLEKGSQNVGAVNCLRRSLIPSLLEAKRINEYRSNVDVALFETAHIYLPQDSGLPKEPLMLGAVCDGEFGDLKGAFEAVIREIAPEIRLEVGPSSVELLDVSRSASLLFQNQTLGHLGEVSPGGRKAFGLRHPAVVGELNLSWMLDKFVGTRRHHPLSEFQSVQRDLNFVLPERVTWSQLESVVRESGGELLEHLEFRETFRDIQKDGPDRKRLLLTIRLRSLERTLSGSEVEACCNAIIKNCRDALQGTLAQ